MAKSGMKCLKKLILNVLNWFYQSKKRSQIKNEFARLKNQIMENIDLSKLMSNYRDFKKINGLKIVFLRKNLG